MGKNRLLYMQNNTVFFRCHLKVRAHHLPPGCTEIVRKSKRIGKNIAKTVLVGTEDYSETAHRDVAWHVRSQTITPLAF